MDASVDTRDSAAEPATADEDDIITPPPGAAFWDFQAPVAEPREILLDDPFAEPSEMYEPHELDPPPAPKAVDEESTRDPAPRVDDEDQSYHDENFEKELAEVLRNAEANKPPPGSAAWIFREDKSKYGRRGGGGPPPRPWAPEPERERKKVKTKAPAAFD